MFKGMRERMGLDASYLRAVARRPPEERGRLVLERVEPFLRRRPASTLVRSPLMLLGQGINRVQRDRMLRDFDTDDFLEVWLRFFPKIATTDMERNWIVWYAAAGHFNHDLPDAVPPYLRADSHERARGGPTRVRFHHQNLLEMMAAAQPATWTHYSLSDAVDWMGEGVQRRLFSQILRTAAPGARVMYRTCEDTCFIERLGLGRHFRPLAAETAQASADERTRMYRRVNHYEVVQ
jgi:S-adenosylmethionine-diacylglycerol 3-amino-3-carboxypropyl transferase